MAKIQGGDRQLVDNLDRLTERAGQVLSSAFVQTRSRQILCRSVGVLSLFALAVLGLEGLRYLAGYPSLGLRAWQYGLLVLGAALAFAAVWLLRDYLKRSFARGRALSLYDRQLGLANRLETAEEFAQAGERSGFMAAAIDDAAAPAQRALDSELHPVAADRRWPVTRWSLLSVPATAVLLLLTSWLGGLELTRAGLASSAADGPDRPPNTVLAAVSGQAATDTAWDDMQGAQDTSDADGEGQVDAAPDSDRQLIASDSGGQPNLPQPSDHTANSQSGGLPAGSDSQPKAAASGSQQSPGSRSEQAAGRSDRQSPVSPQTGRQSTAGEERRSQQVAAGEEAANADTRAAPGDASRADDQGGSEPGQSGEQGEQGVPDERGDQGLPSGEGESPGEEPGDSRSDGETSSAAGGQSEGAAPSEAMAQAQEQGEGQGQGESEEQNEDGKGGQPSARNEEGMGGRGEGSGPSDDPIKKNRGAATAMLALPVRDRLVGVRGEGPEHTRQEQSPAEDAAAAPVAVDARTARGERIGSLQPARVSGWSRGVVKNYFDGLRGEVPGNEAESSNTTSGNGEGEQE